jgi:hypothetical protein
MQEHGPPRDFENGCNREFWVWAGVLLTAVLKVTLGIHIPMPSCLHCAVQALESFCDCLPT